MNLQLSIFINGTLIVFFFWYFGIHVGFDVYYRKYISPQEIFLDDIYYKAKVDAYSELNKLIDPDKEYDVFLGDSLIEQFPIEELLRKNGVLNRGIGCDTTVGVLRRLNSNIKNINISRCFLLIGHNDLKYRSVEETWKNIVILLNKIKAKKKYFISNLPCSNVEYNIKINKLNKLVRSSSNANNFEYINVYNQFEGISRNIKEKYYFDGVHLTTLGYLELLNILKSKMLYSE